MKTTIWKYELEITDSQVIKMPKFATILTVQMQGVTPCLWALVDPSNPPIEGREIQIFGTGHPIENEIGMDRKYIGTIQLHGGSLVFHVFEPISVHQ